MTGPADADESTAPVCRHAGVMGPGDCVVCDAPKLDEKTVPLHVVMVRDDEDSSWWIKGEYHAPTASEALDLAWAGTYHSPRRSGSAEHRYTCAVVSPGEGWQEFLVTVVAQPSKVYAHRRLRPGA